MAPAAPGAHSPSPMSTHTPSPPPPRPWTTRLAAPLIALAALAGALASPAALGQDAPYDRVQRLIQAGEWTAAMTEAESWLSQNPRDPQMRFMQGVIQQQRGEADAALATFLELTRSYPELPEPHNNLAVLHAAAGRLGEAREALEMAIRLNPQYAIAHRNLGDVYLRLAENAFRAALSHAPGLPDASRKLQAIEQLRAAPASR